MKCALLVLVLVPLFAVNVVSAQTLDISQATDGGGWQFTLVLTNTTTSNVTVATAFFKDTGSSGDTEAWTPPFVETVNLAAVVVPAGSSVFLHSTGTAAALTQGWAKITNAAGVEAYVIYTYTNGANISSGTAQGVISASGYLVPFDNTGNIGTELAVVNPTGTSETVLVNYRTSSGTVSSGSFNLPANGQMAFALDTVVPGTAGQSGLAEFYVTSGSLAIIALRSNTNSATGVFSFTTAPVYNDTAAPVITPSGGGGGGGGGNGGVPAGDITFAGFSIGKTTSITSAGTTVTNNAGGQFGAYTPTEWNLPFSGTKIGDCVVYSVTYTPPAPYPSAPSVLLNAGNTLSLSGPSLPAADQTIPITSTPTGPVYVLSGLAPGTLVDGATYTLSGTGGTAVEGFKTSATLPNSFSTNLATIGSIDRSQPLTLTWTGTGFDNVIINVDGFALSGGTINQVIVTCEVAASLQTYAVPSDALSKLPAVAAGGTGTGVITMSTTLGSIGSISSQSAAGTTFTPNLVGGGKIKYGAFAPFDTVTTTVPIQ